MRRAALRPTFLRSASALACAAGLLGACAVGPDFTAPPSPAVTSYDSAPTAATTADGAQQLMAGGDIPSQWWALFHSAGLNQLVTKAVAENPDLAAADAALRVAQDNLAAGETALFPTVGGSFSSQRQKTSNAAFGGFAPSLIYNLHDASVNVSYGLDLFGGTRRAIEQLGAVVDYTNFEKEAAYLSLTANVVTVAIQEASIREQIAATEAIIADQQKTLNILNARFDAGAISKTSVAEQRATLATTKANLPPLQHALSVQRHALSALTGQMPQTAPDATFTLDALTLPQQIPLSLPSNLVAQRPDIQEAEANLHAASAAIGVAVSNRLPQITLSADIGSEATQIGNLFTSGTGLWALGGSVTQTIFDAGALADKEQAARDTYIQASEQYRSTVLAAFQNVADTLHALQSDADALIAKTEADKAAQDSLAIAQAQLKAGAITAIELLTAEQTEQQARLALIQAKAQRYADTAALFAALGGGWWNRDANGLIIGENIIVYPSPLKGAAHD